jgi:hypothetical protein
MYMYMYMYICVCVFTCIHIYIYVYIHIYVHINRTVLFRSAITSQDHCFKVSACVSDWEGRQGDFTDQKTSFVDFFAGDSIHCTRLCASRAHTHTEACRKIRRRPTACHCWNHKVSSICLSVHTMLTKCCIRTM